MKNRKKEPGLPDCRPQAEEFRKGIEILTGAALFIFGVYQSVLYFGHTVVPISDFPAFFRVGSEIVHRQMPDTYMRAPVLGILQNFLYPLAWGTSRELTAGWLLNSILHPFNLLLLWLVGRKIAGKAAAWIAVIVIINPWTVYLLTEPIVETTFLFFILLTFYLIFSRSGLAYLTASIATMVRYEGAALILAAFVADVIQRKERRDVIRAISYSILASVPLGIWLLLTVLSWQQGTMHYFTILFSKEYAKSFAQTQGKRGILLHLQILWQTAFAPLLTPHPGTDQADVNALVGFSKAAAFVSFLSGCIFSAIRRKWEIWMLLLFLVPYFLIHAFYPYPISRYHSTIAWIVLFICWFGVQSLWRFLNGKYPVPVVLISIIQIAIAVVAFFWLAGLVPYLHNVSLLSQRSASMPYAAMIVAGLLVAGRLYVEKIRGLPGGLAVLAVMCLVIISNQFSLASLLGDGKREIEFKQLGEWFAVSAGPGEKLAVYNNITQIFAGKNEKDVVGFPMANGPQELIGKLRDEHVTYVVWATREGMGNSPNDYRLLGLDKNIALLASPRDIGPYKFITQVGNNNGYVNIFRLTYPDQNQPGEGK